MICRFFLLLAVFMQPACANRGQAPLPDDDPKPLAAPSGDVEITSIRIVRQKSVDYHDPADLTKMQLELWLTSKGKTIDKRHLVSVVELGSIEDDTGKVLSTKIRLEKLRFLSEELISEHGRTGDGKSGPVLDFVL